MNGVLKGGRNLPIIALVQITYYKLVEYFVKRKVEAHRKLVAKGQKFTDDFNRCCYVNFEKANSHQVH